MTVRVIQWATGAVGVAELREVIDRPDLDASEILALDRWPEFPRVDA